MDKKYQNKIKNEEKLIYKGLGIRLFSEFSTAKMELKNNEYMPFKISSITSLDSVLPKASVKNHDRKKIV